MIVVVAVVVDDNVDVAVCGCAGDASDNVVVVAVLSVVVAVVGVVVGVVPVAASFETSLK